MRVLFDQGIPRPLRGHLFKHAVDTAAQQGWSELDNGVLLDAAERAGYELLITTDKNIRHQQNLTGRRISILVLLSGAWPYTLNKINEIRAAIVVIQPGELREIEMRPERVWSAGPLTLPYRALRPVFSGCEPALAG